MIRQILIYGLLTGLLWISCRGKAMTVADDPHSFSNPHEITISHIDLDLNVDFQGHHLTGNARLHLKHKTDADTLILDTWGLSVSKVLLDESTPTEHILQPEVPGFGQALRIRVFPQTKTVSIYYTTSPTAGALQWLTPMQTAGKRYPFLFTQSQTILARSWVPCQDSPGVRFTYSARIQCPPNLMAVMSAENGTQKSPNGIYRFEMRQSIPSYLLAMAVGDIEFRAMGSRTGIYAEPATIEKAAWEFADTGQMLDSAEKLLGPYRWERYDIIVLPPSFPFGGMENPRLTFATPTVIAGDKSLVALIAHELAHSWSGNLVTNAFWHDIWLNEGLTTYFERRLVESIYGKEYAEMEAIISRQIIDDNLAEMGPDHELTALYQNIDSLQPDDVSDIVYEKGYFFLRMIEENVGRERWDAFLRKYFEDYSFKTITTENFLEYLDRDLIKGDDILAQKLNVRSWIFGRGMPANCPIPHSDAFAVVDTEVARWNHGIQASGLSTKNWKSQQWIHFLRNLSPVIARERMHELDKVFGFSLSGNSEILFAWLQHVISNQYEPSYPALERFLIGVGRRKFLKPLYTSMAGRPAMLLLAKEIYLKARPGYHPISYTTIDDILTFKSN